MLMSLYRCGSCRQHFDFEVASVCPFCEGSVSRVSAARSLTKGAALVALLSACGGTEAQDTTPEPVVIGEPQAPTDDDANNGQNAGDNAEPIEPAAEEPVSMPEYGVAPMPEDAGEVEVPLYGGPST